MPTTKCDNCGKGLTKKMPGLECRSCGKVVHANQTCSGLMAKQLAALRNSDAIDWTCLECQHNAPHRKSSFIVSDDEEDEEEVVSVENSGSCMLDTSKFLKDIMTELKIVLKKELQPIETALGVCCNKIDELSKTVESHNKEIKDLGVKYNHIKNEQVHLQLEINSLKQHVRRIDQRRLDNVLELSGLPKLQQENLTNISCELSRILNMNKAEIEYIKRVDGRNGRDGIIQIGLQQIKQAEMWVRAARKTPLLVEHIASGASSGVAKSRVMLRRALTKANKWLLWQAQQKLRPTYKYVWFQDGNVLIRKDENAKTLVARSEEDIKNLATQPEKLIF